MSISNGYTGRNVLIFSLMVGCFALLWPRVFIPMFQSSYSSPQDVSHQGPADHRAMHPSLRAGHLRDSAQPGQPPSPHSMGRQPKRVLDRMARPGPQPGSRPTPGGYGAVPQSTKGTGAMGIIMPIYTIGIVVFFVYTIMKVMFKSPEGDKDPVINDFHLTTEFRSYAPRLGASANGGGPSPPARYRPEVVRRAEDPPPAPSAAAAAEDAEIDQLRRRLEETERAMERIMKQMSTVSEKLNVAKISTNIKAIKKDLWGSMDSVASDSLGSERSLSMESLAQTEASLASLEEDVMKAEKASKKNSVKDKKGSRGSSTNKKVTASPDLGRRLKASPDLGAMRRVQNVKKT